MNNSIITQREPIYRYVSIPNSSFSSSKQVPVSAIIDNTYKISVLLLLKLLYLQVNKFL